jgi:Domain of unknown function (DUF4157)
LPTTQVQGSDGKQIAAPLVDEVLRTPGQPLEPATRRFMERRFGQDFRQIRIHTDKPAAEASAVLGAEAFTVGHHIAFAQARFLPGTAHGRRLVAHELAHTIQQSGATSPHIALKPNKEPVTPAPGSLKFAGLLLGTNRSKKEVRVVRPLSDATGRYPLATADHELRRTGPTDRCPRTCSSSTMPRWRLRRRLTLTPGFPNSISQNEQIT